MFTAWNASKPAPDTGIRRRYKRWLTRASCSPLGRAVTCDGSTRQRGHASLPASISTPERALATSSAYTRERGFVSGLATGGYSSGGQMKARSRSTPFSIGAMRTDDGDCRCRLTRSCDAGRPTEILVAPSDSGIDPQLALDLGHCEGAASGVVRAPLFERADCLVAQLFLGVTSLRSRGRKPAWVGPCRPYAFNRHLAFSSASLLDHTSLPHRSHVLSRQPAVRVALGARSTNITGSTCVWAVASRPRATELRPALTVIVGRIEQSVASRPRATELRPAPTAPLSSVVVWPAIRRRSGAPVWIPCSRC